MNKGKRITFIIFSLLVMFVSCSNLLEDFSKNENKKDSSVFIIKGHFSVPDELKSPVQSSMQNPRTALPTTPTTGLTYTVTAKEDTSGATVTGTVTVNASSIDYELPLTQGTWDITATITSSSSKIYSGKIVGITVPDTTPAQDMEIKLSLQNSTYDGNIELPVMASSNRIAKATASFSVYGNPSNTLPNVTLTFTSSNRTQNISKTNVAPGPYDMRLDFFDASNALLYSVYDVVNVFENTTTNTFTADSGSYVSGGKIVITDALINTFLSKTFYVKGASGTLTGTASDSNNGGFFAPFATMQKAADTIKSINDTTSEYTIFVDGTLNGTGACVSVAPTSALKLKIQSLSDTTKATLNANSSGSVISIDGANANVTLKNLIITGGSAPTGGGVAVKNDATVNINDCNITSNEATAYGGGVFVNPGKVTITDSSITNNNAATGGQGGGGAGVFIKTQQKTTIQNCTIEGNNSLSLGGGICIYDSVVEIKQNTKISSNINGGVYIDKLQNPSTVTIENSIINENTLTGGVYVSGIGTVATLTNCTINENTGQGGVCVSQNGQANLNDCTISSNEGFAGVTLTATTSGGTSGTATIIGGSIVGNKKGGIYVNSGVLSVEDCSVTQNEQLGGIYVPDSATYNITLDNCTISGNKDIHNNPTGIGIGDNATTTDSKLEIKGATKVGSSTTGSDYVFLPHNHFITITDNLTTASESAYINLTTDDNTNTSNHQILTGAAGAITSAICDKFHVIDSTSSLSIAPSNNGTKGILQKAVQTKFYVSSTGDDNDDGTQSAPYASMKKAIDEICAANDTNAVPYTIYVSGNIVGDDAVVTIPATSVSLDNPLDLTIQGTNKTNDKLDANSGDVVVTVDYNGTVNVTIKNLTITGGKSNYGGGVYVQYNTVNIENCNIQGNRATSDGGGIYVDKDATVTLKDCVIQNNTAASNGGGIYIEGANATLNVQGATQVGSTTDNNDIYLTTPSGSTPKFITVSDSLSASAYFNVTPQTTTPGTVVVKAGTGHTLTQNDCDCFNLTNGNGITLLSGEGVIGAQTQFYVINSYLADDTNAGTQSAPLATMQAAITKIINANSALSTPGSTPFTIYVDGPLTGNASSVNIAPTNALDLTIEALNAPTLATLDASGTSSRVITINAPGSDIKLNSLLIENGAGGVKITDGTVTFDNCSIQDNTVSDNGGGVLIDKGTVTFNNACLIKNNSTSGSNNDGGGVAVLEGTVIFNGAKINNNTASSGCNGGGVYINSDTTVTFNNCEIASNNGAQYGGGVYSCDDVTFNSCTIKDNIASSLGSAIYPSQCDLYFEGTMNVGTSNTPNDIYLLGVASDYHIYVSNTFSTSSYVDVALDSDDANINTVIVESDDTSFDINQAICDCFNLQGLTNKKVVAKNVTSSGSTEVKGVIASTLTSYNLSAGMNTSAISVLPSNSYTFLGNVDDTTFKAIMNEAGTNPTGTSTLNFGSATASGTFSTTYNQVIPPTVSEITFPNGFTSVPDDYAKNNTALQTVTFSTPANLTSIGARAFYGCSSLSLIDLSNTNVTSIGKMAFESATNLEIVKFPLTLTSIGNAAFESCTGKTTEFYLPAWETLPTIETNAFHCCSNITLHVPYTQSVAESKWGSNWLNSFNPGGGCTATPIYQS